MPCLAAISRRKHADDVLSRSGRVWTNYDNESASYTNDNKRQGWDYDGAGNTLSTSDGTYTYDAAARPVTFASSQTWQVYPNWPSNHPDAPALQTQDTFDGTGQVVKHVATTRRDDSYDNGYGPVYLFNESTITTYYVHSTVLGGKTIQEVNGNTTLGDRFVYAGGARIATYHPYAGYNQTEIECSNPVTGASITTDANGSYATRQEPDPLGRNLASPPDPAIVLEPPGNNLIKQEPWPIEYTGFWTGEREIGLAQYERDVNEGTAAYIYNATKRNFINALLDLARTGDNKYFDKAQKILAKNPNFSISINGGKSVAGNAAAAAFRGAMAKLPGDPQTSSGLQLPSNESDKAMLATVLGEASTPGEGSWGPNDYGRRARNNPTRTVTEDDVYGEMSYMIFVVDNRLQDWGKREQYSSWKDVIEKTSDFKGYQNGKDILKNLSSDSAQINRARIALDAIRDYHAHPIRENPNITRFYYWKGIKQPGKTGPIVTLRGNATRIANTDFSVYDNRY